jgi:hypothetical protein
MKMTKITVTACLCILTSAVLLALNRPQVKHIDTLKSPQSVVLAELYTSEGCSSCPPAEALWDNMRKNQVDTSIDIILLAFHVDYWNRLGWTDAWSKAAYSNRQRWYNQVLNTETYTPQAIINGHYTAVGSDKVAIGNIIKDIKSKKASPAIIHINSVKINNENMLEYALDIKGDTTGSDICLAIAEDSIRQYIKGGENKGRYLVHNGVVRYFENLRNKTQGKVAFTMGAPAHHNPIKAVAFLQNRNTSFISSVSYFSLQ